MNILKSIGAVLAGLIFIGVSHNLMDFVLESLGIFTPTTVRFDTPWMVSTAMIYRTILSILGCYLTGLLAPSRPLLHAMILGAIGLVLSTAAAIVTIPLDWAPAWYPIALVLVTLPCAWIGGMLAKQRSIKTLS